jgi:predicted nucleic acid-binding protein
VIAYIDSSVVLRVVLRQPGQLSEWSRITTGVTSGLLEVECLRTLDRLRGAGRLSGDEVVVRQEEVYRIMEALEPVELTTTVLHRAAQPMAASLGTLDAIHLASAEVWRDARKKELIIATHDRALALAARATGFRVIGV